MRFKAAQATCQSALASHKHQGKALAEQTASVAHGQNPSGPGGSKVCRVQHVSSLLPTATAPGSVMDTSGNNTGVTPEKHNGKIKYASARIKLLRVDTTQEDSEPPKSSSEVVGAKSGTVKLN